jgi:hypothetical protein
MGVLKVWIGEEGKRRALDAGRDGESGPFEATVAAVIEQETF